jgi:hypothetical protein
LILSQPFASNREWDLMTLLQGYRSSGRTNALWDTDAKRALEYYVDSMNDGFRDFSSLTKATTAAIAAGCKDPMIQYLRVRYETKDVHDFVQAFDAMLRSQYHPRFKFLAGLRAAEASRGVNLAMDRSQLFNWTTVCLEDYARDTNAPLDQLLQRANQWLDHANTKAWHDGVGSDLVPIVERRCGTTELGLVFLGQAEIRKAWDERGRGYAGKVSEAGWKGFEARLDSAEGFLNKAWRMNTNRAATAHQMMRVELGQGQGLARMDRWFKRVMALDTNHYDAAMLMSFYLEPRWYGSEEKCLTFARTCVASPVWGGKVPLALADTHRSLAKYYSLSNSPAYWQRPQVWTDVKSSYDKFFKLHPESLAERHEYALDAFNCGQYASFLQQAARFGERTNYSVFGGPQQFQAMLDKAAAAGRLR